MTTINPYLTFAGKCEEAFEFYRSVFGGEFLTVMRMGDSDCGMPVPDAAKDKIMHVVLPIGTAILMGSDTAEGFGPPVTMGNNFSVAIGTDKRDQADKLFEGRSAGGRTVMPMADAFWGGYFGMFIDKFGVQWMINCDEKKEG